MHIFIRKGDGRHGRTRKDGTATVSKQARWLRSDVYTYGRWAQGRMRRVTSAATASKQAESLRLDAYSNRQGGCEAGSRVLAVLYRFITLLLFHAKT